MDWELINRWWEYKQVDLLINLVVAVFVLVLLAVLMIFKKNKE